MFASTLLRRFSRVSLSLIRRKSFVIALRPSLTGSVLQNVIYRGIFNDLGSDNGNLAKKFLFDDSTMAVLSTAEKLAVKLEKGGIEYAFVGGFALNVHGFKRQTTDVDILVTQSGLQKFKDTIVHNGVTPRFRGAERSFRDPVSNVGIDLLVAGDFPGDGKHKDVAFPEPVSENITDVAGVKVINLQQLITLKLAAYQSLKQARMKDRTDVAGLVKYLSLGTEFAERLPESVRREFIAVVEDVIEEEEFEQKRA